MTQMLKDRINGRILISRQKQDVAAYDEWKRWLVRMENKSLKERVNQEFIEDFIQWLQGRSTYNSTEFEKVEYDENGRPKDRKVVPGTPWGNKPLTFVPGVCEFLDQGIDRRDAVIRYLTKLKMRGPRNVDECWMYFKYIIRGVGLDENGIHEVEFYSRFDYPEGPDGTPSGPDHPAPPLHNAAVYSANFRSIFEVAKVDPPAFVGWLLNGAPPQVAIQNGLVTAMVDQILIDNPGMSQEEADLVAANWFRDNLAPGTTLFYGDYGEPTTFFQDTFNPNDMTMMDYRALSAEDQDLMVAVAYANYVGQLIPPGTGAAPQGIPIINAQALPAKMTAFGGKKTADQEKEEKEKAKELLQKGVKVKKEQGLGSTFLSKIPGSGLAKKLTTAVSNAVRRGAPVKTITALEQAKQQAERAANAAQNPPKRNVVLPPPQNLNQQNKAEHVVKDAKELADKLKTGKVEVFRHPGIPTPPQRYTAKASDFAKEAKEESSETSTTELRTASVEPTSEEEKKNETSESTSGSGSGLHTAEEGSGYNDLNFDSSSDDDAGTSKDDPDMENALNKAKEVFAQIPGALENQRLVEIMEALKGVPSPLAKALLESATTEEGIAELHAFVAAGEIRANRNGLVDYAFELPGYRHFINNVLVTESAMFAPEMGYYVPATDLELEKDHPANLQTLMDLAFKPVEETGGFAALKKNMHPVTLGFTSSEMDKFDRRLSGAEGPDMQNGTRNRIAASVEMSRKMSWQVTNALNFAMQTLDMSKEETDTLNTMFHRRQKSKHIGAGTSPTLEAMIDLTAGPPHEDMGLYWLENNPDASRDEVMAQARQAHSDAVKFRDRIRKGFVTDTDWEGIRNSTLRGVSFLKAVRAMDQLEEGKLYQQILGITERTPESDRLFKRLSVNSSNPFVLDKMPLNYTIQMKRYAKELAAAAPPPEEQPPEEEEEEGSEKTKTVSESSTTTTEEGEEDEDGGAGESESSSESKSKSKSKSESESSEKKSESESKSKSKSKSESESSEKKSESSESEGEKTKSESSESESESGSDPYAKEPYYTSSSSSEHDDSDDSTFSGSSKEKEKSESSSSSKEEEEAPPPATPAETKEIEKKSIEREVLADLKKVSGAKVITAIAALAAAAKAEGTVSPKQMAALTAEAAMALKEYNEDTEEDAARYRIHAQYLSSYGPPITEEMLPMLLGENLPQYTKKLYAESLAKEVAEERAKKLAAAEKEAKERQLEAEAKKTELHKQIDAEKERKELEDRITMLQEQKAMDGFAEAELQELRKELKHYRQVFGLPELETEEEEIAFMLSKQKEAMDDPKKEEEELKQIEDMKKQLAAVRAEREELDKSLASAEGVKETNQKALEEFKEETRIERLSAQVLAEKNRQLMDVLGELQITEQTTAGPLDREFLAGTIKEAKRVIDVNTRKIAEGKLTVAQKKEAQYDIEHAKAELRWVELDKRRQELERSGANVAIPAEDVKQHMENMALIREVMRLPSFEERDLQKVKHKIHKVEAEIAGDKLKEGPAGRVYTAAQTLIQEDKRRLYDAEQLMKDNPEYAGKKGFQNALYGATADAFQASYANQRALLHLAEMIKKEGELSEKLAGNEKQKQEYTKLLEAIQENDTVKLAATGAAKREAETQAAAAKTSTEAWVKETLAVKSLEEELFKLVDAETNARLKSKFANGPKNAAFYEKENLKATAVERAKELGITDLSRVDAMVEEASKRIAPVLEIIKRPRNEFERAMSRRVPPSTPVDEKSRYAMRRSWIYGPPDWYTEEQRKKHVVDYDKVAAEEYNILSGLSREERKEYEYNPVHWPTDTEASQLLKLALPFDVPDERLEGWDMENYRIYHRRQILEQFRSTGGVDSRKIMKELPPGGKGLPTLAELRKMKPAYPPIEDEDEKSGRHDDPMIETYKASAPEPMEETLKDKVPPREAFRKPAAAPALAGPPATGGGRVVRPPPKFSAPVESTPVPEGAMSRLGKIATDKFTALASKAAALMGGKSGKPSPLGTALPPSLFYDFSEQNALTRAEQFQKPSAPPGMPKQLEYGAVSNIDRVDMYKNDKKLKAKALIPLMNGPPGDPVSDTNNYGTAATTMIPKLALLDFVTSFKAGLQKEEIMEFMSPYTSTKGITDWRDINVNDLAAKNEVPFIFTSMTKDAKNPELYPPPAAEWNKKYSELLLSLSVFSEALPGLTQDSLALFGADHPVYHNLSTGTMGSIMTARNLAEKLLKDHQWDKSTHVTKEAARFLNSMREDIALRSIATKTEKDPRMRGIFPENRVLELADAYRATPGHYRKSPSTHPGYIFKDNTDIGENVFGFTSRKPSASLKTLQQYNEVDNYTALLYLEAWSQAALTAVDGDSYNATERLVGANISGINPRYQAHYDAFENAHTARKKFAEREFGEAGPDMLDALDKESSNKAKYIADRIYASLVGEDHVLWDRVAAHQGSDVSPDMKVGTNMATDLVGAGRALKQVQQTISKDIVRGIDGIFSDPRNPQMIYPPPRDHPKDPEVIIPDPKNRASYLPEFVRFLDAIVDASNQVNVSGLKKEQPVSKRLVTNAAPGRGTMSSQVLAGATLDTKENPMARRLAILRDIKFKARVAQPEVRVRKKAKGVF